MGRRAWGCGVSGIAVRTRPVAITPGVASCLVDGASLCQDQAREPGFGIHTTEQGPRLGGAGTVRPPPRRRHRGVPAERVRAVADRWSAAGPGQSLGGLAWEGARERRDRGGAVGAGRHGCLKPRGLLPGARGLAARRPSPWTSPAFCTRRSTRPGDGSVPLHEVRVARGGPGMEAPRVLVETPGRSRPCRRWTFRGAARATWPVHGRTRSAVPSAFRTAPACRAAGELSSAAALFGPGRRGAVGGEAVRHGQLRRVAPGLVPYIRR